MAVLVIVGLARSGKDTVADYLAEKYKYYRKQSYFYIINRN